MKSGKNIFLAIAVVCLVLVSALSQTTTGRIRGVVKDPSGAIVSSAKVTVTNKSTNVSQSTQSSSDGVFLISNLLPGIYKVNVEVTGFKNLVLDDVQVELNQTLEIVAQVEVGVATETITVSAGGVDLIDTTSTTLSKGFSGRQLIDLAQTSAGGTASLGVNNLSLLSANVSNVGGIGAGSGGSVGGQRPRNNNFMVDGIDNNDKSVTGPQTYVSPENVAEFSLLTNQFSAEFNRSNGGQFLTATKNGTNLFHGQGYGYFQNRFLNALDNLKKRDGVIRERIAGKEDKFNPRSDFLRSGAQIGGPIFKDKLFFYGGYERMQQGNSASPGNLTAPTAAGLAAISSLSGISQTNFSEFKKYIPVAPAQNFNSDGAPQTIKVCSGTPSGNTCPTGYTDIPVGSITFPYPSYSINNNFVVNIDYSQSDRTQHRARFHYNDASSIDTGGNAIFTQFFSSIPFQNRLFSYTMSHVFSEKFTNETRLSFRRTVQDFTVPDFKFPGLDAYPNFTFDDLGINLGPSPNNPQFGRENNYQVINNSTYLLGNHSLKFGVDFRVLISPQSFVGRSRGDYEYSTLDLYLHDISPDVLAQRGVGLSNYYGNQKLFFPYIQNDWKVRSNLTLNLGVNYSLQTVTKGAKTQALNSISSVPGFLQFREPKVQNKNFGPRIGLAYSPNYESGILGKLLGAGGKSSIRTGFSMAYDYVFDNLLLLSLPPQSQTTIDLPLDTFAPNFVKGGAIPGVYNNTITDPATARANTGNYIPDQMVPYSLTYSLSLQRELSKNWGVEFRYMGTRGVHLLTQSQINRKPRVTSESGGLPTFNPNNAPTQAQIDATTFTLADIQARSNIAEPFNSTGFNQVPLFSYRSNGNSIYHAFSTTLTRRLSAGLNLTSAYTWSHLIDDTTAEVFTTVLSPRRVQDFYNFRAERADSALDRRHRFVTSAVYELPFFKKIDSLSGKLLGGFSFTGTLTFESGQKATVLSGQDSNLNGDSAPDRTIFNPNGVRGTASGITTLMKTCPGTVIGDDGESTCILTDAQRTVGYVAVNPNAQYIRAGLGTVATAGRNTLQLPGINNFDFGVFKNFALTESKKIQFRADFINAFNHPQYIPSSPSITNPFTTTGVGDVNTAGRSDSFNKPDEVFSSNSRVIQLGLKFIF